jgi:hypothetical protein
MRFHNIFYILANSPVFGNNKNQCYVDDSNGALLIIKYIQLHKCYVVNVDTNITFKYNVPVKKIHLSKDGDLF